MALSCRPRWSGSKMTAGMTRHSSRVRTRAASGPAGAAAQPDHVDPHDPVADAVAKGADQQDLFDGKHGQGGPGVAGEGEVADQQRDAPVNADGQDAPARTGDRSGPGLGQSQPLPRVLGDAGCVRSAEPGAYVFAINHHPSLSASPGIVHSVGGYRVSHCGPDRPQCGHRIAFTCQGSSVTCRKQCGHCREIPCP